MMLQREKLNRSFGGIINMSGMPDLVVVFSVKAERLAIEEAKCVGIPVIGIVDTNANPDDITFPIPGNDDSLLSFSLYSDLFSGAILSGTKEWSLKAGAKKAEKAANGEKGEKSDKSEKGDKREKGKFDRKSGDKKRFGDKSEKGEKSDKPKHFSAKIEKKTRLADKKPEAPAVEAAAEVSESASASVAPAPAVEVETTAAE